ncbi:ROK family transcriptional regulator [Mesorhizobium sp.]|uniref:ROK family transcriptional regulator n=1 Tax=Mesorhizobium sp. TaxID=1871066 RepID=UPI00122BC477|nr:ROK family transcriptional regulator [Mesorhizobium sp.]TIP14310.1 MAG: ROK family transcriptional regulator [Mesorhizobium sp.]
MAYSPDSRIAPHFLRSDEGGVVSPNERHLLHLLWRHPGLARSEVTAHTDLAQQSVYRIIDRLAERGIVAKGSPKPGLGSGQPSPMLRLDSSHAYSAGISVNADVIDICIMNFAGNVLAESSVPLRERSMTQSLELVAAKIEEQQQRHNLAADTFFGIGFAIAGFHVGGTRFNASLPLHEWSLIELGPLLADFFSKPVWVLNGGQAGAVAESMFGVGRFIKHFAYISFNYGLGGGLISDGELLAGGNGNAAGFTQMYPEEEVPHRPALQSLLEQLNRNGVDVPSITYMRKNFDPKWRGVSDWLDDVAPAYNRLINAIWAVFDPHAIVFGGQVPPGLAQLLSARTDIFGRPRYGVSRPVPKLIISEISNDAAAMGAAVTPFKSTYY